MFAERMNGHTNQNDFRCANGLTPLPSVPVKTSSFGPKPTFVSPSDDTDLFPSPAQLHQVTRPLGSYVLLRTGC